MLNFNGIAHPDRRGAALHTFEENLAALIGRPTDLRPFVCDGSPLDCQVFIVGANAATAAVGFWEYWSSAGFDKAAWFDAYKQERHERPLKPGKKFRPAVSPTRRCIGWILEEAAPIRCLETNIWAAPTPELADLASEQRITAPFDFLLESIRPALVVAHGKSAERHLRQRNIETHVVYQDHFSRGWSEARARELGCYIRDMCEAVA